METCAAAVTRDQARKDITVKPLVTKEVTTQISITKNELTKLQQENTTLEKYADLEDVVRKGDYEIKYEKRRAVLYRLINVPLKNIETETVAEALLDMYTRLGIPEEVLSDLGTQFVSKCMEEVSRLLSIKRLTTTPYHPIYNGLVERFNGTLKKMLRRLCNKQPRQWHRFVNPLYSHTEKRHRRPPDIHRLSCCMGGQYANQFKS